ncbi:MAG: PQQ-binding-like beta-propeller repeat protein [Saprospiraceae bacterium]|nr:PQQ-binding-like beta-propeller repeat protein [Saprospiraceae bacterium]
MHAFSFVWVSLIYIGLLAGCSPSDQQPTDFDWAHYQGSPSSNQYSPLTQVNVANVKDLEVAWTYHSGGADSTGRSQIQCNPLVIDGILYGTSPVLDLFALDAATGAPLWTFTPGGHDDDRSGMGVNRGLAFWTDGESQHIYYAAGSFIYGVDAKTGEQLTAFGEKGTVDLHTGLGAHAQDLYVGSNSPGIIFKDLLIVGTRVSESMGAAPGYVRAFDVHDGSLKWTFRTIPGSGDFGADTWPEGAWQEMGGANAWSGMSIDHERGILFVPTGSAAYDFFGGDRHGENLFANCLLALDASSGKRIWHFQTIHHDLWDRDLPAPPNLVTLNVNGKKIDAVAQISKAGYVFMFDRETGESIFPIEERPVPKSTLSGESAWPTQPVPTKPPRFSRGRFAEEDLTERTLEAHAYVRAIWQSLRKGEEFIPPSEEGTIIFPGFDGGGEWGGASVNPEGIMYVNASEQPWIIKMIKHTDQRDGYLATVGKNIYGTHCQLCHGEDGKGASIYTVPSLENIKTRKSAEEITQIIRNGGGLMPSFSNLHDDAIDAIIAFLFNSKERIDDEKANRLGKAGWKYPYFMSGYVRFADHEGYPAINPPWGTLSAIDLKQGDIKWQVPLGSYPELTDKTTGSQSYGGPVATAGGILFMAGTLDEKIRGFDQRDGSLLWEASLPAAGYATPATYAVNGRQYLVIACGGGKLGTKSGDAYIAYALPQQ